MKKLLALLLVMLLAFSLLTACKKDKDDDNDNNQPSETNYAQSAINFVDTLYGNADAKTGTSYDLVASYTAPGTSIKVAITWTTNSSVVTITPSTEEGKVTVNVPEAGDEDINYTITATATHDGKTATKTYNRVVPSVNNYMTPDQYYAAAKGEKVIVKGIVTGIISKSVSGGSKNELYLNDESGKGGYYVYSLDKDPVKDLGIQVGMTVKVEGDKDVYYQTHEIKNALLTILDETIKTVTPADYTSVFANATALNDKALAGTQGLLVTIKGVSLTNLEESSSGFLYYHFTLNGVESYMGVSHSNNNCMSAADVTALVAKFDANKGATADITGIAAAYDGNFYIIPNSVDSLSNFVAVTRTDAEKVQYELDGLTFNTSVKADNTFNLTTAGQTYDNVVITWTSNNACAVVSADSKTLTVTLQDTEQTVTLTATAAIGNTTATKTFTVKVAAKANYIINKVDAPVAGTAYKLYLFHGTQGQNLFLTGKMDSVYDYNLGTTGDVKQSADFYLETADGGYYLTVTVDGVKKYVTLTVDGKYLDITMDFDPTTVYKFDADTKTLVSTHTTSEGTFDFYFGTYSTNSKTGVTTSKTSYITGSNAANVGKTQFVVYLATITDLSAMTDADKVAAEKNALTVDTTVNGDAEITLPNASIVGVTVAWTVSNNATIEGGKLVITQGTEAITVTLTAAITAGTVTDTKVFTFEVPAKVDTGNGIKVDLETITSTTYTGDKATASGWTLVNGMANTKDMKFHVIVLNGKVGSVGVLTSPTLTGGLTKITFKYANPFSENNGVDVTIQVIQNGTVVAEKQLDNDNVTQLTAYAFEWTLTTPVTGDYQIKIFNNSPSNYSGGNKDRAAFWDFYYYPADSSSAPTITDADKVAAEVGVLEFTTTTVEKDTEIALPAPKVYADDVAFNWSVTGTCATITDGKLVITVPTTSTTVTLTLEIVCGEAKETKTYTITVTAPVYTLTNVTTPAVGTAYKLYLFHATLGQTWFLNGKFDTTATYNLGTTTELAQAADFYLETADGGYYLAVVVDGAKKYVNLTVSGQYVNIAIGTDPSTVYKFDDGVKTLVSTQTTSKGTNDYYFGTYATNKKPGVTTSSTYYITGDKAADVGVSQFVIYLATYTCNHDYTSECDTACNVCGATRTTTAQHTVTDECDADCNVCGAAVVPTHKYTADCATTCVCTATRETTVAHTTNSCEDTACAACNEAVTPKAHAYDGCEDTECNNCTATREKGEHAYDGCEDTECNNCTATREAVEHAYSSVCDATCNNEGCDNVRDAESCTDKADNNGICDNEGCGKGVGPDTPEVDVPVDEDSNN